MDIVLLGGLIRAFQGLLSATPTLIVGLFVAAVLRYYLNETGTRRLFGGEGLRSLPQAWLVGMLLPVCSIGAIPIIREMRRMGLRPGAITAFALSAPLFNPLSLLYGLTLSRPIVIMGFAFASLLVVTALGIVWDRTTSWTPKRKDDPKTPISLRRLGFCFLYMARELCGTTGALALLATLGLFILGAALPHGGLQSSVEQLDPLAPLTMALVSVPVYATPMLTMSQLGMMFAHGNSPGAAFCLLLLGTGMNLATLFWIGSSYGKKPTFIWFAVLFFVVLGMAYAIERPLIPPGVEPAGHTHAFDIYTNPLTSGGMAWSDIWTAATKTITLTDWVGAGAVTFLALVGLVSSTVFGKITSSFLAHVPRVAELPKEGLGRAVSSTAVGLTCLGGLIGLSVVGCYAYYPDPSEVLEEMRIAQVEVLSSAVSKDYERTLHWIPILDEWSRRLEVGYAIRRFELRPYQRMQAHLLRKKLELLEHAVEHASEAMEIEDETEREEHLAEELAEISELRKTIIANSTRLKAKFQ